MVLLAWLAVGLPVTFVAGRLLARSSTRYPLVLVRPPGPSAVRTRRQVLSAGRGAVVMAAIGVVSAFTVTTERNVRQRPAPDLVCRR